MKLGHVVYSIFLDKVYSIFLDVYIFLSVHVLEFVCVVVTCGVVINSIKVALLTFKYILQ